MDKQRSVRGMSIFLVSALIGLLTLACGAQSGQVIDLAKGEEQTKAAGGASQQQSEQCSPGKEHWATQGPPVRGGTFQTAEASAHLDPTDAVNVYRVVNGTYEWLVKMRMCFDSDTAAIPDLAEKWSVSPDGLTWTFNLRKDVKWQNLAPVNGRQFTSADIAWTLEYIKTSKASQRRFYENVTHTEPDAYTVVLKLSEPNADFLLMLGDDTNAALPHEIKDMYGDFKKVAVGTGPFQVREIRSEQSIVYDRNPNYYVMGADGKPLPYAAGIQGFALADRAATIAALRTGQQDINRGSMTPAEGNLIKTAQPKSKIQPIAATTNYAIWFNTTIPPWNDVRVRKAVSLGINREDIITGGQGGGGIVSGFMPRMLGDFSWTEAQIKERFKYDLEGAKKLLAEANVSLKSPVKFATGSSATYGQEMEVVSTQLTNLGIPNEAVIGADGATASGTAIRSFKYDISYGPPGSCKFPDCWMRELVASGSGNITRMTDPKLDAMASAQAKEIDPVKRLKLVFEEQEYLLTLMPYVPTPTIVRQAYTSCRMKNMNPHHALNSIWGIQHAWIDERGC